MCGRARKGHESPFGKNCELTPLEPEEREQVIAQLEAEEKEADRKYDEQMKDFMKKKAELEEQARKTKELLEEQELIAKARERKEAMEKMQQELDRMRAALEDDQARLINLKTRNEEKERTPVAEPPDPRPVVPVVPAAPAPAPVVLDPALQIYAQAAAAQPAQQSLPGKDLGATAVQIMQENPLLALACGMSKDGAKSQSGKWLAENYALKDCGIKNLTYNEFIHGALRLLLKRVKEHKSILEYLVHYERMAKGPSLLVYFPASVACLLSDFHKP